MKIQVIELYEGVSGASLTAYIPDHDLNKQEGRPAVIVCPGGGYVGVADHEGEPVALKFLAEGHVAFVLRYSIGAVFGMFPTPFIDLAKSVAIIRQQSAIWGIDPNKITVCGFSTGGHVAAMFSATWHEPYLSQALHLDNQDFKPNALILGYPLLNFNSFWYRHQDCTDAMYDLIDMIFTSTLGTNAPTKEMIEKWDATSKLSKMMVPTFLWLTTKDEIIALDSFLDYVKQLAVLKVPYECHLFEKGQHGLSIANNERHNVSDWINLAINWLKTMG